MWRIPWCLLPLPSMHVSPSFYHSYFLAFSSTKAPPLASLSHTWGSPTPMCVSSYILGRIPLAMRISSFFHSLKPLHSSHAHESSLSLLPSCTFLFPLDLLCTSLVSLLEKCAPIGYILEVSTLVYGWIFAATTYTYSLSFLILF
jgi:hypothetical protein